MSGENIDIEKYKSLIKYPIYYDLPSLAIESLIMEARVSPKPGLVDSFNSGSHRDMDLNLFIKSALSLKDYFGKLEIITGDGYYLNSKENISPDRRIILNEELIEEGKLALLKMLEETGGVNTHKGAIFSLGLFFIAINYLRKEKKGGSFTLEELRRLIAFNGCHYFNNNKLLNSHGADVRRNYKISTIDLEASLGYPSLFDFALPSLIRALEEGFTLNRALIISLLSIMGQLNDSNILKRGGLKLALKVKNRARELLQDAYIINDEAFYSKILAFDEELMDNNLSSGGAADILSCTIFTYLYFYYNNFL